MNKWHLDVVFLFSALFDDAGNFINTGELNDLLFFFWNFFIF